MLEVREVLRRDVGGTGLRAIARGTGLDRKTVAKYLTAGTGCGLHPGGAPPTDDQVAMVPSGATAAVPSG
jgi:transposase